MNFDNASMCYGIKQVGQRLLTCGREEQNRQLGSLPPFPNYPSSLVPYSTEF